MKFPRWGLDNSPTVLHGWKNFSPDARDVTVCSRLPPSSSSSSSNIQNGLLKKNRCIFLRIDLSANTLTWNVCEFPSPGICHNSTSSLEKHWDKKAWFLWYNLSRILHCTSSDIVFGPWNPHVWCCCEHGQQDFSALSVRAALGFVSAHRFGPLSMSSNKVNLITSFTGSHSVHLLDWAESSILIH